MHLSKTFALSVLWGALALGSPTPALAWGDHVEQVSANAAKGDAKAQTALGNMYHDGFGVEKDIAKALEWYRKAVDQGYAEAQFRLGHEYAMGHGVTADLEVAVSLFKKAAAQGHGEAQYRLAEYYRVGRGVQKDMFESLAWYKKSADAGYAKAQEVVANYYHEKGEFPQVLTYLEKAAEQNSSVASYALGMMYLQGSGVAVDDKKGAGYIFRAALANHLEAKAVYGYLLLVGQGVTKDTSAAYKHLSEAAEQGESAAMFWLAEGMYHGEIISPGSDMAAAYSNVSTAEVMKQEAREWYEKAAAAGHYGAKQKLNEYF